MKRKLLSLLMAVVMTISLLPAPALAATYQDTAGHWAEDAIDRWSGHGIIQGNGGKFNPGNALTRAHMAAILSRLLKLPEAASAGFKDVESGAWYANAINRCAAAGIMLGDDGYAKPNSTITRQQAVVMLARALQIEPIADPDLSGYTDADQVSSYAVGYLAAMAEAGIVRGTSDTTLSPYANITRAATVVILHRAVDVYADKDGENVTAKGKGLVLVVAENVTVTAPEGTTVVVPAHVDGTKVNGKAVAGGQAYSADKISTGDGTGSSRPSRPSTPSTPSTPSGEDLTITDSSDVEGGTYRNIIITEEVGNGEVSFTDVTITGDLTILGGGSNTIRMKGCEVHGKVKIDKDSSADGSQPPRLHLTDTPVPQVETTQPAIIEAGDSNSTVGELKASDNVTIQGAHTKVETVSVPESTTTPTVTVAEGAKIETLAVAPNATAAVTVNAGASVSTVDAKGETTISAVGAVETVSAAAPITVASGSVDKVEVPNGKSAEVTVSGGATVATVEAKGKTTINAEGNVTQVSAEASVTVASGSVEKLEVPSGKTAELTVSIGAAVISVQVKGETTLSADGTVHSVTVSANITVSSGEVGRVEVPETAADDVSITVSENAAVNDVTVNTTNNVKIDAQGENSVGTVSTDKAEDEVSDLKVTVVGNGNKGQQPSSHNWPLVWTYEDASSHSRICQGHPNHPHMQIDAHSWNAGTVTKAPTCTEAGEMTYTCSLCNGTKTTAISPTGHSIVVDAYQKPTCTEPGVKEGKHCSVCGEVLVAQTEIAPIGHIWSNDSDPDCNVCGAKREVMSEELNKLIAEAEALGLLQYLDKSTLTAGGKVTRLQISMLTGALVTDIDFTSPLYGADIYAAPAWKFSDGAELNAQQKAVIMMLCSNGLLAGYADGTFRPNTVITRGAGTKVLAYALLGQQKADKLIATYTVFNDVDEAVALAPYIEWCAVNGLVAGDRNGNFRPYDALTIEDALRWFISIARDFDRELYDLIAEAEKLGLLKYLDKSTLTASSEVTRLQISMLTGALLKVDDSAAFDWGFSDGKDLTAQQKSVIMQVNTLRMIGGYADGTFRPDVIPTRGAGTKVLAYALLGQQKADKLIATYTVFSDVDEPVALAPYIEWCAVNSIVSGDRNGNFYPYDALTIEDALRWFINAAVRQGEKSFLVTNIRFEDQYIKWDEPTAVTDDMDVHYRLRLFTADERVGCGTDDLFVANYAFSAGQYEHIEITTVINGAELATAKADIDLTVSESTSSATPTVLFDELFNRDELTGYEVTLTGLTPNRSHIFHLVDAPIKWGWERGNFREGVSDEDGNLILRFHGDEAIELVQNGFFFLFEQTANKVISRTEADTSLATLISGQPCMPASYVVLDSIWSNHSDGQVIVEANLVTSDAVNNKSVDIAWFNGVKASDIETETNSTVTPGSHVIFEVVRQNADAHAHRLYSYTASGALEWVNADRYETVFHIEGNDELNYYDSTATGLIELTANTQFLLRDTNGEYTAYTGYKALPALDAAYAEVIFNRDGEAEVVYLHDVMYLNNVVESDKLLGYIVSTNVYDTVVLDNDTYYVYDFYVDGVKRVFYVEADNDNLDVIFAEDAGLYEIQFNTASGLLTADSITKVGSPEFVANEEITFIDVDTSTISISNNVPYSLDSVSVFLVDTTSQGTKITIGDSSDLKSGDTVDLVFHADGTLTAIYVIHP